MFVSVIRVPTDGNHSEISISNRSSSFHFERPKVEAAA